jgi:molecular chaperone HscC
VIVGIDLGTTNSAIGIWRDGRAELIPNSLGTVLTPSAVGVDDQGQILVGLAARERQVTHPKLTTTAFKRYMGSKRATTLGKQTFLPEELSALVLRSLKSDAEKLLGEEVTDAVITVPAYFNDKQRQATRRAGQLAGLRVDRLLNEPTAAALTYGLHQLGAESRFLVFDLGGGTFDVSVLELFDGVIEVRSSTGDNQLGGEDFNEVLIDMFFSKHSATLGMPLKTGNMVFYQNMRDQAERARRRLSAEPQATMKIAWKGNNLELTISEEEFSKASEALLERLRAPVLRALRDSNIRVDTLNEVVLVGGATRMTAVRKAVTKMFGRFPAAKINADEAVALGAAIQAGLKARDVHLKEVVLTDVCPYSLGVDMAERLPNGTIREGLFAPIIERNTLIPASRIRSFSPLSDEQTFVKFHVYQGESRSVTDNILLGEVSVPLPRGKASQIAIDCRFSYDINGLLEVDVHIPATGERRELVIVDDESTMEPSELEKRREALAKLKIHPKDEDINRAVIARAERCFEQSLGRTRESVSQWLSQFTTVMDGQDLRAIEASRAELISALDALEGETLL